MKPGWTTPYVDGSGWRGMDSVQAQIEGWRLEIGTFGIAVRDFARHRQTSLMNTISTPPIDREAHAHLLERALTGSEAAYKALYLMVGNDERYAEYADTVKALAPTYGLTLM